MVLVVFAAPPAGPAPMPTSAPAPTSVTTARPLPTTERTDRPRAPARARRSTRAHFDLRDTPAHLRHASKQREMQTLVIANLQVNSFDTRPDRGKDRRARAAAAGTEEGGRSEPQDGRPDSSDDALEGIGDGPAHGAACRRAGVFPGIGDPPPLALRAVAPAGAEAGAEAAAAEIVAGAHRRSAARRFGCIRVCAGDCSPRSTCAPSAHSISSRMRRAITTAPSVLMCTSR